MALLKFNCRVCAKVGRGMQIHSTVDEFTNLPPGIVCVQCNSCGVMGIEMLGGAKTIKDGDLDA